MVPRFYSGIKQQQHPGGESEQGSLKSSESTKMALRVACCPAKEQNKCSLFQTPTTPNILFCFMKTYGMKKCFLCAHIKSTNNPFHSRAPCHSIWRGLFLSIQSFLEFYFNPTLPRRRVHCFSLPAPLNYSLAATHTETSHAHGNTQLTDQTHAIVSLTSKSQKDNNKYHCITKSWAT